MNKNLLVLCFVFIFLIGISNVSAANTNTIQTLGTFRPGININLIQTCGNCTYNNITSVIYPNSSIVPGSQNVIMTNNNNEQWNWTLNGSLTSTTTGNYVVNGVGDLNGQATVWAYNVIVDQTGTGFSTAQGLLYVVVLILSLVVFGLCLWGAISIPWMNSRSEEGNIIAINQKKYLKLGCAVFAYLLLTWIAYIAWNISFGYLDFNVASNLFQWMFWILLSCMFPIIVLSFIIIIIKALDDKKISKAIERGFSIS